MADNSASDLSGIDPSLLQDFISESQELLDGLDPLFVALEAAPDDMSILDGIFRPVHSVKGNSGFFGLANIKKFAHIMENILGEFRSRKRVATPHLIDLLLKGVDFLRGMINRLAQGDFSGQFLPEEQAHLELLNRAANESGGEGGAKGAGGAEEMAGDLLNAYELAKRGETAALEGLGAALKSFIRLVLPEFFKNGGGDKQPIIGYRLGKEDVTGFVKSIDSFIGGLEKNEKDEALCEVFLTSIQFIEDNGGKVDPEIIGPIEQIKDDFLTIHESGIGFDPLMTSLIRERFDAVLKKLEKYEIGGEGDFYLRDENVSDLVKSMQAFILDIKKLERDSGPSDAFVGDISRLGELAAGSPGLVEALDRIRDDFVTIHESDIGFDDLMQSLISERMTGIMSFLELRAPVQFTYRLGDAEVTPIVNRLEDFVADPDSRARDPGDAAELVRMLQELGEAGDKAGKPEVGQAAAALAGDIDGLIASQVGIDGKMRAMFRERLEKILPNLEKGEAASAGIADSGGGGPAAGEAGPREKSAEAAKPPAAQPAPAHQEASGKTLRVAEEKVDHFMSFVGELIITGEVFAYIQKKLEQYPEVRKVAQEFKNANLSFNELSANLQKSLMEVRRVPLKSVLQKLHRIIRDTAAALNKKIDLEIIGEDVQIDKSLLEGLESPLVHMVRNSADHGVEGPEERKAAGKPETGRVRITAAATEERFTLAIEDDGKGLDVEAIKAKAVSRGILTEEAARSLPDKDAFRLIFNAGLSTARVVTDVSGRGVGMDVVLSNLTRMNGAIAIDSARGKGSVFTITLPMTVTLTVIDGLVAQVGDQFYIIPLSDVRESVRPSSGQVHVIKGSREVLNVRGVLHPIVRLNRILGIYSDQVKENVTDATAVLVQGKHGVSAAFLVDELIGQQSVVVKDLGKEFANIRCLQGGSILGDGRVGLVLSVQGVLENVGLAQPEE
ncbi:MAG: chemotaxis protein CheA [Planctomycetota bacterium]|jgi:two-component system chemotaxis sensor kinase CheA|nr:chemotaxis protein CheA [Planctomycetota bacterium]